MTESKIIVGDCLEVMPLGRAESIDAIVTDAPYGLGFMGKKWDALPPGEEWARECLRVLKPGGHLLCFGGTRTYHRLVCALEDAGFEIRDCIFWLYGTGFPKSLDVSKAIDKAARGVPQGGSGPTNPNHGRYKTSVTEGKRGEWDQGRGFGAGPGQFMRKEEDECNPTTTASEKTTVPSTPTMSETGAVVAGAQPMNTPGAIATSDAVAWQGWGTALKPACEPIVVARKPLAEKTVAANVLAHGTGALNIDACRIEGEPTPINRLEEWSGFGQKERPAYEQEINTKGRWPANVILDEDAAAVLDEQTGEVGNGWKRNYGEDYAKEDRQYGGGTFGGGGYKGASTYTDSGGASRFFYVAKATRKERDAGLVGKNDHPTVKPLALMRWLVRLVTPPGGRVLDPFLGSGTTGIACALEGFDFIGIELDPDYADIAEARIKHWST